MTARARSAGWRLATLRGVVVTLRGVAPPQCISGRCCGAAAGRRRSLELIAFWPPVLDILNVLGVWVFLIRGLWAFAFLGVLGVLGVWAC